MYKVSAVLTMHVNTDDDETAKEKAEVFLRFISGIEMENVITSVEYDDKLIAESDE